MVPMLGFRTDTRDTISESRYILCWGNNPLITMQAYWHLYLKAKERGAKLVVIDPRMSETAARADQWVKIVPGTDAALSLGMLRVIHRENLFDEAFLKKHTGAPYLVDGNGRLMRETQDDANSYLVYVTPQAAEPCGTTRRESIRRSRRAARRSRAGAGLRLTSLGQKQKSGLRKRSRTKPACRRPWLSSLPVNTPRAAHR
jgi:anaerobic selenocysteine-containing dehydrogenase